MTNRDLCGLGILLLYYLVFISLLPMLLKHRTNIADEKIRKTQHIGFSLSIFLLLHLFTRWYFAIGAALSFIIIAYPVLLILEKKSSFKKILVNREKEKGELRKQLLFVQLIFSILIFIYWGLLGPDWRFVVAGAVMAWGFGDAAAALVGKFIGRIKIFYKFMEKSKTFEGTAAMSITAALFLFLTLVFYGGIPWPSSLLISIVVGPVSSIVELFSKQGSDTLTVPFAASVLIFSMVRLFMLLGVL